MALHTRTLHARALALAVLVASTVGDSALGDEVLVIRGVRVLTMDDSEDGGVREAQTVIVADGRVQVIASAEAVVIPPGAHVVDGAGCTLLPGLIDAHVRVEDGDELALYLAHGVTTVRCFGAQPFHLRLRAEVESGALIGPTLVLAADLSRAPGAGLEARLRAVLSAGYDFVHLDRSLDADEWLAAARMAGATGVAVAGTLAPRADLGQALERAAWTIESAESLLGSYLESDRHGDRPFETRLRQARRFERIESIARAGQTLVPMLAAFDALLPPIDKAKRLELLRDPRVHSVSPLAYGKWAPAGHGFRRSFREHHLPALTAAAPVQRDLVRALHTAGLPIAAGSGAMTPFVYPGESLWDELDALAECGLGPLEALRAATRVAADAVGRPDLGRIAVGARADLLLVEGDPAASLAALRQPVGVVFGGRYSSCEALRELAREHERVFRRELPFLRALGERGTEFALAEHSGTDGRPPLRPFTWSRACALLVEGERWRDALGLAKTAVQHHPGEAWPHLAVAEALLSGGDRDAALEAWRRAHDLEQTSSEVLRVHSLFKAPRARKRSRAMPRSGVARTPCAMGLPRAPTTLDHRWAGFRGPDGAGLSPGFGLPHEIGETNVRWRVALPGSGHASPVVWDGVVFLSCVEGGRDSAESRVLLALDLADGRERWRWTTAFAPFQKNPQNSLASATPVVGEDHVFLVTADGEQLSVRAFSHSGELVWERAFDHLWALHGHGASPVLAGDLLIVTNDHEGSDNFVAGLDRRTGATRWRRELELGRASFSTPLLFCRGDGRREVVLANALTGLSSLDAATGELLWELGEERPMSVASPIRVGDAIFASFAGQRAELFAPGDAGAGLAARSLRRFRRGLPSVPTPLALGDELFLWSDGGIVSRVHAPTGEVRWCERVGGNWYASPVFANGHLFSASEEGELVVVSASERFRVCGRFELGAPVFATPAIVEGMLLVRTERELVAFGEPPQ